MYSMLRAEWLKSKRTLTRKLIYAGPLFFALYAGIVKHLMPAETSFSWDLLLAMVFNWWTVLFVPLGIALLCGLTEARERKAAARRSLRALPIRLGWQWLAKNIVLMWQALIASLIFVVSTIAAGTLLVTGEAPVMQVVLAALTVWIAMTALIPLQLLAAAWKGPLISLLLGGIGVFAGVLAAPKAQWLLVPWSWPTRLMSPIVGVHPNGIPLSAGDPLLEASVIPIGITAAFVFLIMTLGLTTWWDARREEK